MHTIRSVFIIQLFMIFFSIGIVVQAESRIEAQLYDDMFRNQTFPETKNWEDQALKKQVQGLVDHIHTNHRKFLEGVNEVIIATESIQFLERDDHPFCGKGHILGAFTDGRIIIKDGGAELNEHTLYHEIGHNVWRQLSTEKREEWNELFSSKSVTLSRYAKMNANENFAENFACYYTNYRDCKSKMVQERIDFVEAVSG